MRIALTGNPNSGKTTMYNALTGKNEKVGNWAGVTVDKKEKPIKKSLYSGNEELIAVDLPGAYSMSPFTSEESVTSSYVNNEHPDVIINIVDSTNLSRSLFFTTQLLELGIPVVVALNKTDVNEKKENDIDRSYYDKLVDAAAEAIGQYGDLEWFISDDPVPAVAPWFAPDGVNDVPWFMACGRETCLGCPYLMENGCKAGYDNSDFRAQFEEDEGELFMKR